jgi:hypothetical protein
MLPLCIMTPVHAAFTAWRRMARPATPMRGGSAPVPGRELRKMSANVSKCRQIRTYVPAVAPLIHTDPPVSVSECQHSSTSGVAVVATVDAGGA